MVVEATAGGTARHVVELALGCHRRGLSIHLVCATSRDPAFRNALLELSRSGLEVDELDMWRELHPLRDSAAVIRLRRIIRDARPDVLHLHSSKAGALGRGAVIGLGRRSPAVVYTPHAYAFLTQAGIFKRWGYWCVERVLLHWTDCVVSVSQSEGRVASQLGAKGRVVIIPNGIDATRIYPQQPKERVGLRVGWLGRMAWQKNPEAAIKASFVLSRLGIDHELLLGGDGPKRDDVLIMIRSLQAEEWVRMLGFVNDTDAFHAGIDVLLMTSRSEGLPYAGLDTMAHAVPIVGFDVPGIQDLIDHGVTGLLAPPDDSGALAAHLARLARNEDTRRALGLAAQQRVRKQFQLEDQIDRLCALYQSLALRRRAGLS